MSDLIATLPTVLAVGISDRLVQQSAAIIDPRRAAARGATAAGEPAGGREEGNDRGDSRGA
ncbi:hypothetical protein ABTE84_21705, partial [Acinetobacter baumannii]